MAFDGFASNAFPAIVGSVVDAPLTSADRRAGQDSDVALHDRVALTIGFGAFGLAVGAAVALVVRGLEPLIVTGLVTVPALLAVLIVGRCLRVLHWSALPLVALVVGAAGWAIASTMLPGRQTDFLPAIVMFAIALPLTGAAFCRAFPAAFAVSMLGMALAAPVGAATMLSIFG